MKFDTIAEANEWLRNHHSETITYTLETLIGYHGDIYEWVRHHFEVPDDTTITSNRDAKTMHLTLTWPGGPTIIIDLNQ